MQWLVDLVLDRIRTEGLAVDRGDPVTYDFTQVDLALDGAWHDLDLSGIIPTNVNVVYLQINFLATAINKFLTFRTKSNVNIANISEIRSSAVGLFQPADIIQFPDANRVIEYIGSNAGILFVRITVKGWDF